MEVSPRRNSFAGGREGKGTHLAELGKVNFESLRIIFKAERDHRVQDVLPADRLSLLQLALLRRLGRDEADKLGHALLHALLGVLSNFRRRRHGVLHDTRNIRDLYFFRTFGFVFVLCCVGFLAAAAAVAATAKTR